MAPRFTGQLDEVRIPSVPRSAAWHLAQYRTMREDPEALFIEFGATQAAIERHSRP